MNLLYLVCLHLIVIGGFFVALVFACTLVMCFRTQATADDPRSPVQKALQMLTQFIL